MIKININMPKECGSCMFSQIAFESDLFMDGENYCCIKVKPVDENIDNGTKPEWCPLIECQ